MAQVVQGREANVVGWEVLVLRDSNLALLLDRAPVERMVESTIYDLLDIVAIDDSLVSIWSWSKEIDVADLDLSGSAMLDRAHLRGGASCSRAVRSIHRLQRAQCEWHALRACCWVGENSPCGESGVRACVGALGFILDKAPSWQASRKSGQSARTPVNIC